MPRYVNLTIYGFINYTKKGYYQTREQHVYLNIMKERKEFKKNKKEKRKE